MRAKTPIFDNEGNVIGVVSIGYLVSKIDSWRLDFLLPMAGVFVLLLMVLMLLSWFFRRAYPPTNAGDGTETDCPRGTPAGSAV
ncbi:sensor kinase [Salmonella enterica subsp. arizonae]|uniref:Sensor kinase n=1 Tax=Salmonella enterica subsp. arizonae TaxID=59203 RepID=A0A379TEZ7_SALER|nr:sensor kinase [Salmonella enterica subsp. arizonae]